MFGKGSDIISSKQFDRRTLEELFSEAKGFDVKASEGDYFVDKCEGKVLASLFFEPSTRTRLSFESAMQGLNGRVISVSGTEGTSLWKGETLEDTIKIVDFYADVIVLRHPERDSAKRAADASRAPIINAGDGSNEHPTQALLDLYTMWKEFGKIDGLTIALVGDLKHARTIHSLAIALNNFRVNLKLIAPKSLELSDETKREIRNKFLETNSLDLSDCDVIYATRIQKERFQDLRAYEFVKGSYRIDLKTLEKLKPESIIMHPLPRVDELDKEVDSTKHARYFEQAKNGLFVRMALLDTILSG
jgi:aspartate carbamoyltransferase catalytic subunit